MPTFYADIPPIEQIKQITDERYYVTVPEDWQIALTDVYRSTKAIEEGRYKDVNAIAAASITALLNVVGREDIPFVFGGDGATVLFPPQFAEEAQRALLATKQLSSSQFNLDLRVGIVPVRDMLSRGTSIRVAKLKMSENFQQAIFTGGGLAEAERTFKDPEQGRRYRLENRENIPHQADFSGFECRWNAVPSTHQETVSLLVKAIQGDSSQRIALYREVLQEIEEIYGDSESRRPVTMEHLSLALNPTSLETEARVRFQGTNIVRLVGMVWESIVAVVAMTLGIAGWGKYKGIVVQAIDNEKFDDTLRMIISGTAAEREQLRAYLQERRAEGELVFGTHVSAHVLVTCVVFDHFGRQVHFVDGSDGGYALAAKEMKEMMP